MFSDLFRIFLDMFGTCFRTLFQTFVGSFLRTCSGYVSGMFCIFPAADPAKDFDHDPQLIRSDWRFDPTTAWGLVGDLELGESAYDPVADLPVRRLIDLEYAEGRYSRESRVLRPVPGDWLLPFLHQRDDAPWITGVDV